jgi:hypothetical protein
MDQSHVAGKLASPDLTKLQEIIQDVEEFEQGQTVTVQVDPLNEGPVSLSFVPDGLTISAFGWLNYTIPLNAFKVNFPLLGWALITGAENAISVVKAP